MKFEQSEEKYIDPGEPVPLKQKPRSIADRIRAMSDEELTEWLDNNDSYFPTAYSRNRWFDWLKQEAE